MGIVEGGGGGWRLTNVHTVRQSLRADGRHQEQLGAQDAQLVLSDV